jgi:hypothetical protein
LFEEHFQLRRQSHVADGAGACHSLKHIGDSKQVAGVNRREGHALPSVVRHVQAIVPVGVLQSNIAMLADVEVGAQMLNQDILQNRSSFEEGLKTEIKDLLSRLNPTELIQATASTPIPNDDSIAQEIQSLTDRIQQLKDRANSLTTQIVQAQATEQKYRDLLNKFEQADYHRSNSQFGSGFDLSSLLTGYIAGQMIDRIWSNIEKAQSWKRETYRPSSSYSDYAAGGHSSNSSLFDFGSSSSSMSHMSSSHSHDSWSTPSSSGGHDSWSTSDSV